MKKNILSVGLATTVVFAASFAQAFAGVTTTSYEPYNQVGAGVYSPYSINNTDGVFEANQNQYQNQYQYQNQGDLHALLQRLLEQVRDLQRQIEDRDYNDDSEVDVETGDVEDIEDDRATIEGEIDINNSDDAYVWFEYGTDEDDLDDETSKLRVTRSQTFSATIRNLDDDRDYFYRAMAEDEDGEETRGDIEEFTTDDNNSSSNDDEPDVSVDAADDVDEDSAEISGDVDMNDFRNGVVFFVYGEDEDQVEDIEDDYDTYYDVDEDGDDLQKIRVDTDLDDDDDYTRDITGLDDDTEYFYSLCVEFEDEDDDDKIVCSSVRDFETDRN